MGLREKPLKTIGSNSVIPLLKKRIQEGEREREQRETFENYLKQQRDSFVQKKNPRGGERERTERNL